MPLLPDPPGGDGRPVFDAPWQARSFAMAVKLHEAGLFTWKEWSQQLSRNIAEHEQHHPIRDNADYYRVWQHTLEELLAARTGAGR